MNYADAGKSSRCRRGKIPTLRKHRSGWGTRKGKIENKRLASASASSALAGFPNTECIRRRS
ncbi:MAG: hypothetical protein ACHQJX_14425, partial [Candidatus Acidiferrales bacterium]